MNWLYYLAEANLYLGVFYLAYCLFLNRDTHYQLKRAYLLFSCIISFILPVLQAGALRPVKSAENLKTAFYYTAPLQAGAVIVQAPKTAPFTTAPVKAYHFNLKDAIWYLYLLGAAILSFMLFVKLFTLYKLTYNKQSHKEGKYRVIRLTGTDLAFSFFNCLFIGTSATGDDTIFRHELVHIRQKHSLDIIFLEVLKIVNWFNPFVYLLENSLKAVHEYIADEQTAAHETDALTYARFLVSKAYGDGGSSLTNSFFNYNLLKKRIIMLNRQRSGNLARLKYLVAIPICAALLGVSTLAFSKNYGWVDVAPANLSPAGFYNNAGHAVTRKLLKVTKDGITTISSQLTISRHNKKVIYTAGNITKADRSLLLNSNNIKVEVVNDSTQFKTTDGRLILPVVNVDGYYMLDHFLHNSINYTTGKGNKGGLVEVGFSLDNDRHITDAKIVKSGGAELDALALNGFRSYKGIVNDDSGKHYKIGVYFFTDDYSIFKTDSLGKDPEFAGELIITNYKYPATVTAKGYEYNESAMGFTNMSNARVVIFDKNGEANWFYRNKCTADDLKMLKDKYGYTFPSSSSSVLQTMHPENVENKRLAYIFDVESYLDAPYADQFYNAIADHIEYPQQAKKTLTGGVVVLNFKLDNNGMISDVNVGQSAGDGFDEAAISALRSYKDAISDNTGKHSIAIIFCVAEKKYRPYVDDKFKKNGYVGELAVSDVKSPYGR